MTPVCEGIFQIWLLLIDLQDKTFNFEDFGILSDHLEKWPLFVNEVFNSYHLE